MAARISPSPRRVELEAAARRLFAERGYHATSMEDLAQALGLRRGSLYTHIGAKSELLAATVERGAEAFRAALEQALAEAPAGDHAARLRAALRAHVGVIAAEPDAAVCYLWEWQHLEGPERERAVRLRDAYEARVRGLVADGVAAGAFRPQVEAVTAARAFLSLGNWTATWFRAGGPLGAAEVADSFSDLLLQGLAVSP